MAEQNTPITITFGSFGIVYSLLDEGSRGVTWLKETTIVFVF